LPVRAGKGNARVNHPSAREELLADASGRVIAGQLDTGALK
jgi:hypothetical protein